MPNLVTLGVEFLGKYKANIDFATQVLQIGPYSMEIETKNPNISMDLDQILSERVSSIHSFSAVNEIIANFQNHNPPLGLIPNIKHSITLSYSSPVALKPYSAPYKYKDLLTAEI